MTGSIENALDRFRTRLLRRAAFRGAVRRIEAKVETHVAADIAATLSGYSGPAQDMVAHALRAEGRHCNDATVYVNAGIVAEAVCRDLPEGYLWTWASRAERPVGAWKHDLDSWSFDVSALKGALDDPVLSPAMRAMRGPDREPASRIWAVVAVMAELDERTPRRALGQSTHSAFVLEDHGADRTKDWGLPSYWRPEDPSRRLRNPELTALILDRPEQAYRISELVSKRSTDDAAVIRSILDADAAALSDGML